MTNILGPPGPEEKPTFKTYLVTELNSTCVLWLHTEYKCMPKIQIFDVQFYI